jgi:threonine dehydrogenase-like Zn-dependent dehydrogenase
MLHARHYREADALAATDTAWLERLITRRVPLEDAKAAFAAAEDEVRWCHAGRATA